jgi:hypothetical protein
MTRTAASPARKAKSATTRKTGSQPKFSKVFAPRARKGAPHVAVLQAGTGLMWAAATLPDRMTYAEAEKTCKDLRLLGYDDWRLPTAHELFGIVDLSRHSPAIDTDAFPDTPPNWHWTSSPDASAPDYAWIVNFNYGNVNLYLRNLAAFVRAVRGPVAASQ